MKTNHALCGLISGLALAAAFASFITTASAGLTFDYVPVGNAGNAAFLEDADIQASLLYAARLADHAVLAAA